MDGHAGRNFPRMARDLSGKKRGMQKYPAEKILLRFYVRILLQPLGDAAYFDFDGFPHTARRLARAGAGVFRHPVARQSMDERLPAAARRHQTRKFAGESRRGKAR